MMDFRPEMETERLVLRPWRDSDVRQLCLYSGDPDVALPTGFPPNKDEVNGLVVIRNVLQRPGTYAICLKGTDRAIGNIAFKYEDDTELTDKNDEAELGFWIGKPFWGRGYMPQAVKELIRYAFEELGLTKLWCEYYQGNEKSKRVQQKCGFEYHHTKEKVYLKLLGETRTEIVSCLTAEQWKQDQ